jgi:Rieske Fe-S protein
MSGDNVDQVGLLAVDHGRRRMLTAATAGLGAVGVAFAAVPFISSWQPSVRAKALGAPVSVDASKLEDGQMLKVVWPGGRGTPEQDGHRLARRPQ